MAVVIDSKMPDLQKEQATEIAKKFKLFNFEVTFDGEAKLLLFKMDRRVVSVPLALIETQNWQDIRFLFRATLGSANSLWNTAADENDWSGRTHYD